MTPARTPAPPPRAATPYSPAAPGPSLDAAVDAALHDRARLREIDDLGLLADDVDPILHEEARAAAEHFGLPIGLVTVVLDGAQYFAGHHGIPAWAAEQGGIPVEWSFCRFAVATRDAVVIDSAPGHPLAAGNPLVEFEGVRCYAGAPLVTSRGHALGSLCVIGGEARAFTDGDVAELRRRAASALARIEARARSRRGPTPPR